MQAPEKLFENIFNDVRITSPRLANFTSDCINRLTAANATNEYDLFIAQLTPLLDTFSNELGELATTQAQQKGKTLTVNEQVKAFKNTMSNKEGVIADAVGGRKTAGYLEFYPKGVTEYSNATKTQMPVLVKRVRMATTANADKLSPTLTALLQGFEASWLSQRGEQQKIKGTISDNRTDRSDARTALELALLKLIHSLATKFPGDVEQCMALFNFNLLEGVTRSKKKIVSSGVGNADGKKS